jgi:hypothetical protein
VLWPPPWLQAGRQAGGQAWAVQRLSRAASAIIAAASTALHVRLHRECAVQCCVHTCNAATGCLAVGRPLWPQPLKLQRLWQGSAGRHNRQRIRRRTHVGPSEEAPTMPLQADP